MITIKPSLLLVICLISILTACSFIQKTNYRDTGLEVPPGYHIRAAELKAATVAAPEKIEQKKGLGDQVSLSGAENQAILTLDKNFDRAWIIVVKALKLADLKITDRNRDEGTYHVNYDPDTAASNNITEQFIFTLFNDQFEENSYLLTLLEEDQKVTISAQLRPPIIDPELYQDEEDREPPIDASSQLINYLYTTIRDDLPDNKI